MSSREATRNSLIRLVAPAADLVYRERPRVRVIALHDVPERARDAFAAKMRRLARTHNVVSLADALDRTGLDEGRLNVALTFDDGFEEHATVVAPMLRELGLPATFFIPSGSLDLSQPEADRFAKSALRRSGSFGFLRSEDVELIAAEPNFEIGGHTAHHVDVGRLGEDEVASEIVEDKAALENLTGRPVRFFAFPFGSPRLRLCRRSRTRATGRPSRSFRVSGRGAETLICSGGTAFRSRWTIVSGRRSCAAGTTPSAR